ncbi:hypothetical protein LTR08_005595 [Meristemomyces frigidus]|nr:hypothetical protein LTR08_005595 [Meristemomyces frigidus]
MTRTKHFIRPARKQKGKAPVLETADDFQEAADGEEGNLGKWRAGSAEKSGRACVRALEIYDRGLLKHPHSFDLAYNKARLEYEATQQPALVAHIGLPLVDLLRQTLQSHRYALRLNEENADVLFNTSQVLTSLAEQTSESDIEVEDLSTAIPLLHEALEMLSVCLSRQEMLLEQQQADFEDAEQGGVAHDPEETSGSRSESQTVTIEAPTTAGDLLDTVHASLSALTTLVSLVEPGALQTLGDMAHSLTEKKAPSYIEMSPPDAQEPARFTVALARATFVGAFADAQYNAYKIETETYLSRLDAFSIPDKEQDATALGAEAEARTEFTLSMLARFESSTDLPADVCWKQLELAQDLYTQATKLETSAKAYMSRADIEMLRHRVAIYPHAKLADSIRKSAPTLAQNAYTYYKGAARLASDEDAALKLKALQRMYIVQHMRALLYGVQPDDQAIDITIIGRAQVESALVECVEEGLLETSLADAIVGALSVT